MKKFAALLAGSMMVVIPLLPAPPAHAVVCAQVRGYRVAAGGCTDAVGRVVAMAPYWAGQPPCYTPYGQPYWTPDGDPC